MICDECYKTIPYQAKYFVRYKPRDHLNFCSEECLIKYMTSSGDISQEINYEPPANEARLVTFYLSTSASCDELEKLRQRLTEDNCNVEWWNDGFTFDVDSEMSYHVQTVLNFFRLKFCTS